MLPSTKPCWSCRNRHRIELTHEEKCKVARLIMVLDDIVQAYPHLTPNIKLTELRDAWSIFDGKKVVVLD